MFEIFKGFFARHSTWPQWVAAFEIFLISNVVGLVSGWTSPSLVRLAKADSEILISPSDASWIASLISAGRAIGSLIGAIMVEYLGSKTAVTWVGVTKVLGLICLAVANSPLWILASRLICGISMGMFFMSFPLFLGEISNPKIRGALVGGAASGMSLGYVLGNVAGTIMSLMEFSLVALVPTILFAVSFARLPKSPHHLILKGQMEEASATIKFYQRDADVPAEFECLKKFVQENNSFSYRDIFNELMIPHNRRGLIIVNVVYILMQMSGLYTVSFYMETILTDAQVTILHPSKAVIAVSVLGLVGGVIAMLSNDIFGRKVLLAVSSGGVAMTLIAIGVHFEFLKEGFDPVALQWFPIVSIIFFENFINYGIVTVPCTILSEIFAPNVKNTSVCITNVVSSLFAFFATQSYQDLLNHIGDRVYYFYALMMVLLSLFSILCLPETKGKSLQEIQQMLKKK